MTRYVPAVRLATRNRPSVSLEASATMRPVASRTVTCTPASGVDCCVEMEPSMTPTVETGAVCAVACGSSAMQTSNAAQLPHHPAQRATRARPLIGFPAKRNPLWFLVLGPWAFVRPWSLSSVQACRTVEREGGPRTVDQERTKYQGQSTKDRREPVSEAPRRRASTIRPAAAAQNGRSARRRSCCRVPARSAVDR